MTQASQIALIAIPVAIAVNVLMLVTVMTRVVNVDIWNIWHMTFTGAMLHIATGSYWIGILGVVVHAAFVYKLGTGLRRIPAISSALRVSPSHTAAQLISARLPCWSTLSLRKSPDSTAFTLARMISRNALVRLVNR